MHTCVLVLRRAAIWNFYSGFVLMDAHGTNGHVSMPLGVAIWKSYSGHVQKDAHGTKRHVKPPQKVAIWKSYSGHVQKDAHGTKRHVSLLFKRWPFGCPEVGTLAEQCPRGRMPMERRYVLGRRRRYMAIWISSGHEQHLGDNAHHRTNNC
jgi:hypothetical protein